MSVVFYNKELVDSSNAVIPLKNRAFHYGDGFFESVRIVQGIPMFVGDHYRRIHETARALKMEVPGDFTIEEFSRRIHTLIEKNELAFGGRVRVTLSRSGSGFYLPEENGMDIVIEADHHVDSLYTLNATGRTLDIYPDIKKQITPLSTFKLLNCQLYIMASLYAKEKGIDDALIQNMRGNIIESTTSNLFIVSNGVLYTPGLEDGSVGGVMRMQVINAAIENRIKVYECSLSPQHLLTADEIFLTNAIRGVQWVSSYRTKRYFNETSRKLVTLLNDQVAKLI